MNYNDNDKDVFILRGLPGAGKSKFAKRLAGGNVDAICEADQFMVDRDGNYDFNPKKLGYAHGKGMDKFKALVDITEPTIVVSNTSTKTNEFNAYKTYAEEHGYNVTITIVENYHGNNSVHDVPEASMNAMRDRFQIQL